MGDAVRRTSRRWFRAQRWLKLSSASTSARREAAHTPRPTSARPRPASLLLLSPSASMLKLGRLTRVAFLLVANAVVMQLMPWTTVFRLSVITLKHLSLTTLSRTLGHSGVKRVTFASKWEQIHVGFRTKC